MANDNKDQKQHAAEQLICDNRKARHSYEVLESVEAGIVLVGTEVKSLREGKVHLDEAYCRITEEEAWLVGAHIAEYEFGNRQNHLPTRRRKLLLRKAQLRKLEAKVKQKGLTLVPLKLYFGERGIAKCLVGVCRGRKNFDKRQKSKAAEAKREIRDGG